MKRLATITAAASLFAMLTLQQSANANTVYVPVYTNQPTVQVGVPCAELGGATVYPDGSFSNNGVSWNGADPAGGWNGRYTLPGGMYRNLPAFYGNVPAFRRNVPSISINMPFVRNRQIARNFRTFRVF